MKGFVPAAVIVMFSALRVQGISEEGKVKLSGREWAYVLYVPKDYNANDWRFHRVAVLVHAAGQNGASAVSTGGWSKWADKTGCFLLAPTFTQEGVPDSWYAQPAAGADGILKAMLKDVTGRYRVYPGQILMFGFSAGAQFTHRFAAANPRMVAAFGFSAPGEVDSPSRRLMGIPVLVMCGENDGERLAACRSYYQTAHGMGMRPIWRSWPGVGHELDQESITLAQQFLKYHLLRTEAAALREFQVLVKTAQKKAGYQASATEFRLRVVPFLQDKPTYVGKLENWVYFEMGDPRLAKVKPSDPIVFLPSSDIAAAWGNFAGSGGVIKH
ncbi:MAG: hypothetical protein JW909_10470 [Planctomycetes bacterium]|nr:hypothetical protein [Planctomycetota bacterium]